MKNKIYCTGTKDTFTEINKGKEGTYRVRVWFENDISWVNNNTYYKFYVQHKPYKHKLFVDVENDRISEQEKYESFFNHWQTLNPIRLFSDGMVNGVHNPPYVERLKDEEVIVERFAKTNGYLKK
jgi:hypothetical protein